MRSTPQGLFAAIAIVSLCIAGCALRHPKAGQGADLHKGAVKQSAPAPVPPPALAEPEPVTSEPDPAPQEPQPVAAEPDTSAPEPPTRNPPKGFGPPSTSARPPRRASRRPASEKPSATGDRDTEGFGAIENALRKMREASAAFAVSPSSVPLHGDPAIARFLVSPKLNEVELLQQVQGPSAEAVSGQARIAPRMTAHLVAEGADVLVQGGQEERTVSPSGTTEWSWSITPKREGKLPVTVTLTAPVIVDGRESPYEVRTFKATLVVNVTPAARIGAFIGQNWKWLWTVGLPAAGGWFLSWRRRSVKRANKAVEPTTAI